MITRFHSVACVAFLFQLNGFKTDAWLSEEFMIDVACITS